MRIPSFVLLDYPLTDIEEYPCEVVELESVVSFKADFDFCLIFC